jgi:hypothetical protein
LTSGKDHSAAWKDHHLRSYALSADGKMVVAAGWRGEGERLTRNGLAIWKVTDEAPVATLDPLPGTEPGGM